MLTPLASRWRLPVLAFWAFSGAIAQNAAKEAYVIERLATDVAFSTDGAATRERALVVRLQSAEAVRQFGVATIPYDSETERVDLIEIRVRKPDGTLVATPEASAQDMPSAVSRLAPMYSDLREKQIPVKGLAAGDVLETRIRWIRAKSEIPGHFWYSHSFVAEGMVIEETLRISAPAEKYVRVHSPGLRAEETEQDGRRIWFWKTSHIEPAAPRSAKIPPQRKSLPSVQLTTFRNWEEVGQWYRQLAAPRAAVTPAIQTKAAELTKGLATDHDKALAIYRYVATQFRYVSISFGAGRYQPHAAEEVLSNLYGDCKDKHTLFAALLKAVGIDAWPALIGAGIALDPDLPSPGQFNHLITFLPREKEPVWLDTTAEVAPWGMLQAALRDAQALVIPGEGHPALMTTPAAPPFARAERFEVKGALDGAGTFTAHIDVSLRGDVALTLKTSFRQTPPAKWLELAQIISYSSGFVGAVSNLDVQDLDDTEKPLHFSYDYLRKDYPDWANLRVVAPLPPILFPYGANGETPSEPIELGMPGELVYRASVRLPAGYSGKVPENTTSDAGFAAYNAAYSLVNGVISAERRVVFKQPRVPVSAWADYLRLQKAVLRDTSQWIQLERTRAAQPGAAQADARAQKLMLDAIDSFKKEIAIHPGNTAAYYMLAQTQVRLGQADAALDTWRALVGVAPNDADAVAYCAATLLGLRRYAEAMEAVEGALKTHPGNGRLEILRGEILLRSGKTDEALAVLRQAAAAQASNGVLLNNIAFLLADTNTELSLARECAERAVDILEGASAKLTLPGLTDNDLALISLLAGAWDTLGWVHFRLADLATAEEYLRAAWMLAQSGALGDHLGQLYERQGKTQAAIYAYQLALAAGGAPQWTRDRLASLGAAATSQPAAEELGKLRTTNVPALSKQQGSAEFFVLLSAGKAEDVQFISGAESLRGAGAALLQARFDFPFPDQEPEKLVRRGILSCSQYTTPNCQFVFLLPGSARK